MTPVVEPIVDSRRTPLWSAEDLGILNHLLSDSPNSSASRRAPTGISVDIPSAGGSSSAVLSAGVVSPLAANRARAKAASTAVTNRAVAPAQMSGCAAPDQALSKEERLRRKYQRRYKRRVGRMQDLRDQVASLEALLASLSLQQDEHADVHHWSSAFDAMTDVEEDAGQLDRALALASQPPCEFTDDAAPANALPRLTVLRMRLQQEHALLKRLFHQSTSRMQLVREVFHSHQRSCVMVNGNRSFVLIKPLTVDECNGIRRTAMDEFRVFSTNEQYVRLTSTTCGWNERRVVENGVVNYALKKTFFYQSADFLAGLSWRLLTDPVVMESVYSATLQMHCHVVQRVDDDNFVILQEYVVDGSFNVKSLYLVSRESNERGHMHLIRGLGSERLEFLNDPVAPPSPSPSHIDSAPEIWNDVFMWCQQEYYGDKKEHTVSTVSGVTPLVGTDPRFWVTEIMLEVIRCEQICFGPRFSLPE